MVILHIYIVNHNLHYACYGLRNYANHTSNSETPDVSIRPNFQHYEYESIPYE